MDQVKHPYLQLHLAVFLFGFTAILGKLISLDQYNLVWHRMWIAGIAYFLIPGVLQAFRKLEKRDYWRFGFIGVLVAVHWVTFYGSIKIGNSASLTLACFGTITMFTAFLEPILTKARLKKRELLLSLLILAGLWFVYQARPEEEAKGIGNYSMAIVWGVLSSAIASLFSVLSKKWIPGKDTRTVSSIQLLSGFLFLSVFIPLGSYLIPGIVQVAEFQFLPSREDVFYLILLSLLCTTLAFVLELNALKKVTAFVANLVINLEPIYGIIMAALIFKEHKSLNLYFYSGTLLILISVFLHPIINRYLARNGHKQHH
jgi:drug/metabolite transporter (DMT)-like permease